MHVLRMPPVPGSVTGRRTADQAATRTAIEGTGGHVIKTSLPADIEARLRQALQSGAAAATAHA
jgi:uncharacterized membrane protein